MIDLVIHYEDYSISQRIQLAIAQAQEGGINREKALSLIALSGRESGYEWVCDRGTIAGMKDDREVNCRGRAVIGLEARGSVWPNSWQQDAEALAFIRKIGIATNDYPAKVTGMGLKPNSNEIASAFEWAVARQRGALLDAFSEGATQIHLAWADCCPSKKNYPLVCGRRQWWDDIWNFYCCYTAAEAMDMIHYLDPGYQDPYVSKTGRTMGKCMSTVIQYPAANHSRNNVVSWLQWHVGSKSGAEAYYDGKTQWPNSDTVNPTYAYPNLLARVEKEAAAAGW